MKLSLLVAVLLTLPAGPGFEFRGLKTGMSQTEAETIMGTPLECFHRNKSESLCAVPPEMKAPNVDARYRRVYVILNAEGLVCGVGYRFNSTPTESVESFAKALTAKYGKPVTSTREFRNKLGVTFTGVDYGWRRGSQLLKIEETCGGGDDIDTHCLHITDEALAPKSAAPEI